jgi:hypothetical protein
VWVIHDCCVPTGPNWEMVFYRRKAP